jgi:N6-adenosine-specific RNA methylase IME4
MTQYSIIYADPAWSYDDKAAAGERGAGFKYPVMDVEAIKLLPVEGIAADDSILFLWATFPMIAEALAVIRAWKFEYKTVGFVWIKTNKKAFSLAWGMGNWTRSNAEVCLIGTRGHPLRKDAGIHSVVVRPRMFHSKKPPEIRHQIVKLCGDLPRIELFAREKEPGWHVWGNEVESDIDLPNVKGVTGWLFGHSAESSPR